jgi:serine protease Do
VAGITPDGPAAKAGIEPGDVVTRFDGKEISSMRGLPRIVSQTPIGKQVDVELLRKGQKLTLQAMIGRLQEDADNDGASKPNGQSGTPSTGPVLIGMRLEPVTDDLRKTYGLDQKVKGVVVTSVEPQSQAAQKGIKAGDVIVEASQDPVASAEDVAKSIEKVRKAGRKAVLLRVEGAKGDMRFVAIPIE